MPSQLEIAHYGATPLSVVASSSRNGYTPKHVSQWLCIGNLASSIAAIAITSLCGMSSWRGGPLYRGATMECGESPLTSLDPRQL